MSFNEAYNLPEDPSSTSPFAYEQGSPALHDDSDTYDEVEFVRVPDHETTTAPERRETSSAVPTDTPIPTTNPDMVGVFLLRQPEIHGMNTQLSTLNAKEKDLKAAKNKLKRTKKQRKAADRQK